MSGMPPESEIMSERDAAANRSRTALVRIVSTRPAYRSVHSSNCINPESATVPNLRIGVHQNSFTDTTCWERIAQGFFVKGAWNDRKLTCEEGVYQCDGADYCCAGHFGVGGGGVAGAVATGVAATGVAGEPDFHDALLAVEPGGGTGAGMWMGLVFDQQINSDVLDEVREGRTDERVAKKAKAPLLADVLRECGTEGEHRCCELFIDAQTGGHNANNSAHRVIVVAQRAQDKMWFPRYEMTR
jgi:hypothetical protein